MKYVAYALILWAGVCSFPVCGSLSLSLVCNSLMAVYVDHTIVCYTLHNLRETISQNFKIPFYMLVIIDIIIVAFFASSIQ